MGRYGFHLSTNLSCCFSCFNSLLLLLPGFKSVRALWPALSRTLVNWLGQSLCPECLYFLTDTLNMEMTAQL